MKLGISTFTFGWAVGVPGSLPPQPLDEQSLLAIAVELGVELVQFGDNLPLHEFSKERLALLKAEASRQAITLEVGARGLTRDKLEQYISIASSLDSNLLRFVIDDIDYYPTAAEVVSIINVHLPTLRAANVRLGIENHDRFKVATLSGIMQAVNDNNVGICLDCVNSMGAGEGLQEVVKTLAPYTINLHIKDFQVTRLEHKMGFKVTGAKVGTGMTDVPMLLGEIEKYGRCKTAVLEQWVPPGADIFESINKERQWAAEGIAYLKCLPAFGKNLTNNHFICL